MRVTPLAALVVTSVVLLTTSAEASTLQTMWNYLGNLQELITTNPTLALIVIAALAFGESFAVISLLLPFWAMLVGLGAILGTSPLLIPAWIAASVGASLGDWVSYSIGYRFHDWVAGWKLWKRYPKVLPYGHSFFERWGVWAIVIGRFSGPLRASVPIVAGLTQMGWWKFQIANWMSAFLWAGVLLGGWPLAVKVYDFLHQYKAFADLIEFVRQYLF